jgi:hypothetical protein
MIMAASRGDNEGVHKAATRMAREVPDDGVAGTYLWYLVHHRVLRLLGRTPTAEDLRLLAEDANPRFARALPAARTDRTILERTLWTFFDLAAEDEQVTGGRLVLAGAAALGVMLDDPAAQLAAVKPHLAEWWRENLDDFRSQGLLKEIKRA